MTVIRGILLTTRNVSQKIQTHISFTITFFQQIVPFMR